MRFKEKTAGVRKHRTNAEGFVEDFQKAMTKVLVDLEGEKVYNDFIERQFSRVTKPIPAGKDADPGWVEIVGNLKKGYGLVEEKRMVIIQNDESVIPQQIRYQMPTVIYKRYQLLRGLMEEASTAVKVMNSINRYWRINILTAGASAATNFISGGIQYSSKVLTDFYTETLTGNVQYTQTKRNIAAMLQVLLPKGWSDAPDWIYGGDLSNFYGQFTSQQGIFDKGLDSYADKALKLFSVYERYWKKVITLSETTSDLKKLEEVGLEGLKLPTEEEQRLIAEINAEVDLYAYDYDNAHPWLEAHQKSVVGQALKPFLKYPYKYAKHVIDLTGAAFDQSLPWQVRVSKLLALSTIMAAYAMLAADREEEKETPDPSANTPARLSPRGRLFITKDSEGKELFVRIAKYPFVNLTAAGEALISGSWEESGDLVSDMLGSIAPPGKIIMAMLGIRSKFEVYTPLPVIIGDSLVTYLPAYRILSDVSRALDPYQRRRETFGQSFTSVIPTTDADLQRKLHGEIRTERIPLEGEVEALPGEGVTRTTTDRVLENYWQDIVLGQLTGLYVTRINPEYAKAFEIRGVENQVKKYDELKDKTSQAWDAFTAGELTKEDLGKSGTNLLYKRRALIQETEGWIEELQVADNDVKKKILRNKIVGNMEKLIATD